MTVLEGINRLVEYFAQNDYFDSDSSMKLTNGVDNVDKRNLEAVIAVALEELEKQNFIVRKNINGSDIWVLYKPIGLQEQEIQISLLTALEMAKIVNVFATNEKDRVNPLRVSEQDIVNLMLVAKRPCP